MRKQVVCLFFFILAVFLLTYLDWVVNAVLYGYGLQFNRVWHEQYSVGYLLCYQLVIGLLFLYLRSWKATVLMEAFVLSSTQDLVYFGVWRGCGEEVD